nr:hypothetical protein [Lysobacter enzymogenes]
MQVEGLRAGGERQRQLEAPLAAVAAQRLAQFQPDPARALGRDRIDAQLELVAGGLLQQGRVGAAALDRLEHFAALVLGHRHRRAQAAVDVQGEAVDLLALAQRKLQFAFEHAVVGVAEHQLDRGVGQAAAELGVDARRFEPDRGFGLARHQQRRRRRRRGDVAADRGWAGRRLAERGQADGQGQHQAGQGDGKTGTHRVRPCSGRWGCQRAA